MSKIEEALEKAVGMRDSIVQEKRPAECRQDAANKRALPVFQTGTDPVNLDSMDPRLICVTDPLSSVTEQFRKLRAKIIRSTAKDFRNIIMVTSSCQGEGKSFTAANLAIALAQEIDHTVLLVDADLRVPSIHKFLGIQPEAGLSDYLKGDVQLSDVLVKTGLGKLVFLPAGTPPENPAELISSQKARDLMLDMKNRYKDRYVIIDSSPVLLTAEPLSLSRYVDGIVFVIQADRTAQKDVSKALALVKESHILGTVLNNVPHYLTGGSNSYYDYKYSDRYTKGKVIGNG